ncbi:MAG: ATPase domain-containing protein [bacterium]
MSTGIPGLDHLLRGGLPQGMTYLIHGGPGTGKTTLGFQFLLEGVRRGERVLYASLLQTRSELEMVIRSHGWSLEGIDLLELPDNIRQRSTDEQTLFSPGDIELHEVTDVILQAIQKHRPQRLVFDSITELAVLVDSRYQLRRQMLKLKQQLSDTGCTTLFTVNDTEAVDLPSIQTAVHGVLEMGIHRPKYGPPARWVEATKMRGLNYLGGRHDLGLQTGGIVVFPRLEIHHRDRQPQWTLISSGNVELDALFGGGLEEGTACLITGTTGAGKSTLASVYVSAAAERGDRSIIFCFDERKHTFLRRSEELGMGFVRKIEQGLVDLRQVDVGALMPGEFAEQIRYAVDERGVKVVVIDSIGGYLNAMPEQQQLIVQLHELLSYLGEAGVLTILIMPMHGLGSIGSGLDLETSYIADTVVMMRHFEAVGEVRRCVSVLKKRHGHHERTIREITIGRGGVHVGPSLVDFQRTLSGTPEFIGHREKLMQEREDSGRDNDSAN